MYSGFYGNKRFLVTGVAGVKGSWLALALLRAGAEVIGLDKVEADQTSNYHASGLGSSIRFVRGDVADSELMASLAKQVDGIFHLAAVALVRQALHDPLEAYRSNTLGVVSTLEALRNCGRLIRAVFVTTDKVYRPKAGELWVESDPLVASGPYAVSKACAEYIIADYQRSYFRNTGVRIGVGRAGNVIIGGDFYSSRRTNGGGRILVDCFEALAEHREPEIYSPGFTRPYTYGLDIASGYMTLMSQLDRPEAGGEAFNFGPCEQYGIPNSLLASKFCELWGSGLNWRTGNPREEPFELQSLSIRKSREVLGWRPVYTIYESLRDSVEWDKAWTTCARSPAEGCMQEVTSRLLDRYETSARRMAVAWAVS